MNITSLFRKQPTEQKVLKQIHSFQNIEGWLTDKEAVGLYTIAHQLQRNAVVVEIGSWQGKSTYCLAKGLRKGTVYAIDPFNADAGFDENSKEEYLQKGAKTNLQDVFLQNMRSLQVDQNISVLKGYSKEFHHQFQKIDFLFIDGDHSIQGCTSDFELYAHKIVRGGYLAFHDYYENRPELGPTHVIHHSILPSSQYQFYKQFDSLWIAQKMA